MLRCIFFFFEVIVCFIFLIILLVGILIMGLSLVAVIFYCCNGCFFGYKYMVCLRWLDVKVLLLWFRISFLLEGIGMGWIWLFFVCFLFCWFWINCIWVRWVICRFMVVVVNKIMIIVWNIKGDWCFWFGRLFFFVFWN